MRVIYPGNKRIQLDGGLNNKFEVSVIDDNESPDCLNVVFDEGTVATREGYSTKTVSGVGSAHFDGIYSRKANTGAETMIAWVGGTAYTLDTNTFVTIGSAQSVYTALQSVCAAQYENHIFFGNGGSTPYKYNGVDFTRHGVYQATSDFVVSNAGSAGNLSGSYQYKVSYMNTNLVEGDVSPAVATITCTSHKATLTVLPCAPQSWGVSYRKIYRTATSGAVFKLVTTINDNTTSIYVDNTADASLGAEAPTDQGVPPNYSLCIYYRDRLFVNDPTNPNYVWYSELGEPYTFKATSFFKFGDNTTDLVKGFAIVQNALITLGDESYMFTYMPDSTPGNWVNVQGQKQFGCKSPKGIFNFQDKVMFPALQNGKFIGFVSLNAQGIEQDATFLTTLSAVSDVITNRIEPDMFQVQESYLNNIASVVYKNKAYITLTYGAGNLTNNRVYVFDFSSSNASTKQKYTWVPWTGLNAKSFVAYDGSLYFADSTGSYGHVYKMLDGTYDDNGSAINSYVWTKEFYGPARDMHYHKDFRGVYILAELTGSWDMNMVVKTDSNSTGGDTYAVSLDPGGSTWGSMEWGVDLWGGGRDQDERIVSLNQSGKRIQFKFTNQNVAGQWFKVHAVGFEYNRKGLR